MKRIRRTKITPEIDQRCAEIADLKRQIPTLKQLETETGIKRMYLAKIIHRHIHSKIYCQKSEGESVTIELMNSAP